jgi:hypothetical protein
MRIVSDRAHIAAVAGEPDRIDLAGTVILRDDAAGAAGRQTSTAAVLITGRDVEITAAPIEARHLHSLCVGAQIRQPIQSTVGVPAHRPFAESCDNRRRMCCACDSNTSNPRQQYCEHRTQRPNSHRTTRAWASDEKTLMFRHSARILLVNESMWRFRYGASGGMNDSPTRPPAHLRNFR